MSPIAAVSVTSTIRRSGVDIVADQLLLYVSEHALVCDRQRREVHGDASASLGQLAPHERHHLADHHAIDLLYQAVALRRGQEATGRRERAVGVVSEPDQRLVVRDGSAVQRDDRLVVEDEQVLRARRAAGAYTTASGEDQRARRSCRHGRGTAGDAPLRSACRAPRSQKLEVESVVDVGIALRYSLPPAEIPARSGYVEVFDRKRHRTSSKMHNHAQTRYSHSRRRCRRH